MKEKSNISETLEKGLRVLDLFCADEKAFSLSEISRRLGINKTSVYRYVNTLCERGYLQKGDSDKLYRLGVRTIPLAHAFLQKAEIVQRIKPYVDEVHKLFTVHIDVGIIQNNSMYLVYRRESLDTMAFASFTFKASLNVLATGKAALAFLDEERRNRILEQVELKPMTGSSITNVKHLEKELETTRKRGYSINKEEFIPGLIAIGAPIYNLHKGEVTGGISFDASTSRYSMEEFEDQFSSILIELSKKISAAISQ